MNMQHLPENHPPVKPKKRGILLINLGTPDHYSYWPMRRYLKEFLSDRRVVDVNRVLWWFILNGPILTFRPSKSGKAYKSIWKTDTDESPLRFFTREQGRLLADKYGDNVIVDWAMRYGNPSIESKISALKDQGCQELILFALYPQYCAATMASTYDKCFDALKKLRWQPAIRTISTFHDDDFYIKKLAKTVKDVLTFTPDLIVTSYHGIPKRYHRLGDPYHCYCCKTTRLLSEKLPEHKFMTTFQSRFGPEEWLQPYTDKTLEKLPSEGVKKIAIMCPAFFSDCLETLEEINEEAREIFLAAGGEEFTYIPCLNHSQDGIDVLSHIIEATKF